MARKTLDSNSKRKAVEDVEKAAAEPTGDELVSSMATKKKKIETTAPNKKPSTTKKPQHSNRKVGDSNNKAAKSKRTQDSTRKLDESNKNARKTVKKVKFESPAKTHGKNDEVEVKKGKANKQEAVKENGSAALYAFPMNRVTRIVKSQNSDVKLSAEAAFLFNKAAEKFIELFSKEAYACASKDGKKKIEYQHLSSLIPGNPRFDFLSDFVPAKVKVADALKEIPSTKI